MRLPIVGGELALTALVNVGAAGAHDLLASGQALPRGAWAAAVINTGTTLTCVSRAVLRQFGLAAAGQGTSQTALGPMVAEVYRVSLSLLAYPGPPGPVLTFADMNVLELPTQIGAVEVLVGTDVVLTCNMIVEGTAGQFTLDF